MKVTVAVLDKAAQNAAQAAVSTIEKTVPDGNTHFWLATPSKLTTAQNTKALCPQKEESATAICSVSSAPERNQTQMLNTQDSAVAFDGRIYAPQIEASAAEFVAKEICSDQKETVRFLGSLEGDFSVLMAQPGSLFAARDPVGVQPLYYGENQAVAALASNRKTLWALGIAEPESFPPGHLGVATKEGFMFKPFQTLAFAEPQAIGMDEAAKQLQKLLEQSVRRRVSGLKEVAVAFSGGLDSSVVAWLAKRCGVDVQLIHVSLEGQPETDEARRAAVQLDLPMQVHLFTEADVEKAVPKVVELIEEPDPIKASVGVPFYWNAQKAAEAGYRVLLAGQGADELFGGYQRYVNEYLRAGDDKVRRTMFHDVAVIHESNIERDEKICNAFDVELRLPFASFELAEFAMSLPTELKFEGKADSLRKLALRRTAKNWGLPNSIAEKPKKAVQYSTGISNALKRLAKKQNLSLGEYINQLFLKTKANE
ncbi:MAG: asparagine synthetase B [Candidatus Bathyarchaeota archaeon]|nr:asparagine synthetase B [Candidatus Bathyarchaeota archaeon]